MKKICCLLASVFSFSLAFAQPANDNCSTAQAIGSLPTPAACPSGVATSLTIAGTLNAATAANPYTYQGVGCTGSSTTMASPAIDVWYTFVATGYQLSVIVSGSVVNPNIAMYSGTCAALGGGIGGCAVGTAGGAATLTVQQMVPGTTYYLQVSGNSTGGTGNFSMNISNSIDCIACLGATNLTVTPPPTNGAYAPGTTVNFCYKVNGYTQVNTNWLHGVQLTFGAGWNLASLTTTSPPSCAGSGSWAYYTAGITDNSGQHWPAGFYYDYSPSDGNPGNNFGDNCSGTISAANWNFCFSITTAVACIPGSNLSATINTSGDGESGSWTNLGCSNDPSTSFSAIGTCCPPTMSSTPASCFGGSDGTATATPVGAMNPYTYTWTNSTGVVVSTTSGVAGANTATGLPAGTYTVSVIDKNNCLVTNTVTVTQPTVLTITPTPVNASCGSMNGSISVVAGGGTPGYNYAINGGAFTGTTNYTGLGAGTYTMAVQDSKGCIITATANIITTGTVSPTANSPSICNGNSTILTAAGATTYNWNPGTGLSATTGASVTANPTSTTTYTITGTSGGCTGTVTSVVTVNPLPTINVTNGTVCNGASAPLTASGATTYTWSPAIGLSATTGANVTANPAATTSYTVTGTDANGCVNTGTTIVTVSSNPTVTVAPATICVGQQTATLTAGGATTYVWTPATGLSSTIGTSVTANPATTTAYTITGTIGTCTAIGTTTVTVNPLPTIIVNSGTICVGQQTANLNAAGAITYTWIPSTGLSATNTASVVASPTTTTSYTVVGIDANSCINFATTSVVVNPLPIVTVNHALICNGNSATLTANGAATYTWTPGTGLSSPNGSPVTASPAITTSYTVTGTDVNGCIDSDTTTVTVVNNPIVTVTTGTICVGQQTATLTASGATTFVWTPATGLSSTIGTSVTANPATTTAYTITGTIGTCTAIGTTTVTVNSLPVPTIGSNTPCVNQTLNLNAGGATGYSWNGPNNFTSTLPTPSITGVTIAANGIYTVTVTDINTCVNTATVSVVVNPLPVVTATGSTVCLNATINLTATGGTSYSWSGPGAYSSNQQSPTISNATTAMAGSYVVTVTNANNCVNANVAQVGINSLPNVSVNSGTICVGQQTANLNATGANSYSWSPSAGLSATTGTSVNANPAVTSSYTVTGTDLNNCKNMATLTVTVNPLPLVTVSPQITSGCAPVCVNFSNTATGNGTCNWNFGNGTNSTLCAPNNCFTAQGNYSVSLTLTDNNGCIKSSSASVTVYPVPHADFYATPQPTTILDNFIHFYDLTTGAFITSWTWTLANDTGSAIQNPSYLYGDTGSYAVQLVVISNHGCKDSIIKIVRIDDDYSLYVPNSFSPNSDGTNDIFYAKGEGVRDFKMYIFDRWGNQIFFSDNLYKGWDGRYQAKGDQIVQEDVYVWKIEVNNVKGEKRQLSGHVSLLK